MIPVTIASVLMFVGPTFLLVGALLIILLALLIARLVFSLGWRLLLIGGLVLGAFWLMRATRIGTPGGGLS